MTALSAFSVRKHISLSEDTVEVRVTKPSEWFLEAAASSPVSRYKPSLQHLSSVTDENERPVILGGITSGVGVIVQGQSKAGASVLMHLPAATTLISAGNAAHEILGRFPHGCHQHPSLSRSPPLAQIAADPGS